MKKILSGVVSVLTLCLLAGCGAKAAASAAGHYEFDKAQLKAAMSADAGTDPAAAEMIGKMVDGMSVTADLKADGTAVMAMKAEMMGQKMEDTSSGTWKLDGGKLSVTLKNKDGKDETKTVDYVDGSFTIEHVQGGKPMRLTFHKK